MTICSKCKNKFGEYKDYYILSVCTKCMILLTNSYDEYAELRDHKAKLINSGNATEIKNEKFI